MIPQPDTRKLVDLSYIIDDLIDIMYYLLAFNSLYLCVAIITKNIKCDKKLLKA